VSMTGPVRASLWHRLYHGQTDYRIVSRWKAWFVLSGLVIGIGVASLLTRELNLGIDFEGGSVWSVPVDAGVTVEDARDTLRPLGLADAKIQVLEPVGGGSRTLRVQSETQETGEQDDVSAALAQVAGTEVGEVNLTSVGPSWGEEVTRKAVRALVFFFVAITIYISLRFEWKMAVAGLAAVVHDILVTVGVYSVFQFEVTPATVIAFLTILGYSLYDTIVVFDKVEENTRGLAAAGKLTYSDTVNLSMNQVLMRSLNTSITALLPIVSLLVVGSLILGATTLQEFALALLVGLLTGAYSSIFIASPLLALLKEREPRYRAVRERLQLRGLAGARSAAPVALPADEGDGEERPPVAVPSPDQAASRAAARTVVAPRARKKGRRR
jgi:preprotein translocase subunit SecF